MIERTHFLGDLQPLLRWAVNRGESKRERREPPEPFNTWVRRFIPEQYRQHVGFWVGISNERSPHSDDGEWLDRFPHRHIDSMGWPADVLTVMTYLAEPLEGGEIAVGGLSPDDPYEDIEVELGMTLVVDAETWHGVRPIKRGTRIVLLTTGLPG